VSFQRPRIDLVADSGSTAALASIRRCRREIAKLDEQIEAELHMRPVSQPRPIVLVNVAGRERGFDVAIADMRQYRLGGTDLDRVVSAIDTPRMAFEIVGEGDCLAQCLIGYRTVTAI